MILTQLFGAHLDYDFVNAFRLSGNQSCPIVVTVLNRFRGQYKVHVTWWSVYRNNAHCGHPCRWVVGYQPKTILLKIDKH